MRLKWNSNFLWNYKRICNWDIKLQRNLNQRYENTLRCDLSYETGKQIWVIQKNNGKGLRLDFSYLNTITIVFKTGIRYEITMEKGCMIRKYNDTNLDWWHDL